MKSFAPLLLLLCFKTQAGNFYQTARSFAFAESLFAFDVTEEKTVGVNPFSTPSIFLSTSVSAPFFVKDLMIKNLSCSYLSNHSSLNAAFGYRGNEYLQEKAYQIRYARQLFEKLTLGSSLNLFSMDFPESRYQKTAIAGYKIFAHSVLSNSFSSAIEISRHQSDQTQKTNNFSFAELKIGFAYRTENTVLSLAVKTESNHNPIVCFGSEVCLLKMIHFRSGYISDPDEIRLGLGYSFQKFRADASFGINSETGNSSVISLNYRIK